MEGGSGVAAPLIAAHMQDRQYGTKLQYGTKVLAHSTVRYYGTIAPAQFGTVQNYEFFFFSVPFS